MPTGWEMDGIKKAKIFAAGLTITVILLVVAGIFGAVSTNLIITADTSVVAGVEKSHYGLIANSTSIIINFLAAIMLFTSFVFGSVTEFVKNRSLWSTGRTSL